MIILWYQTPPRLTISPNLTSLHIHPPSSSTTLHSTSKNLWQNHFWDKSNKIRYSHFEEILVHAKNQSYTIKNGWDMLILWYRAPPRLTISPHLPSLHIHPPSTSTTLPYTSKNLWWRSGTSHHEPVHILPVTYSTQSAVGGECCCLDMFYFLLFVLLLVQVILYYQPIANSFYRKH